MTNIKVVGEDGEVNLEFTGPNFKKRFGYHFIVLPLSPKEALALALALGVEASRIITSESKREPESVG